VNPSHSHLSDARKNQLLAALPDAEWDRWRAHLEPVDLALGRVLCESGSTPAYAYFPTTAIVSLLYTTNDGASAEIAVVGNDGVVGISLFMGGNATPSQAVVQSAGKSYRLRAQAVKNEIDRSGPALSMLLRYTQAVIAQVAQTAMCNRYHSIDQQLCRRLLVGLDRSATDELVMTQELAANLLGVRREGVTAAALKLQQAGVIRYRRGHIAVLDRQRLEQRTCECYAVAKKEYDRLLPMPMRESAPMPPGAAIQPRLYALSDRRAAAPRPESIQRSAWHSTAALGSTHALRGGAGHTPESLIERRAASQLASSGTAFAQRFP
jgi:CRP-like cAMP-binding protein